MEETSNVPKLRFKEFTKPWEAQKLGEILTLPIYLINVKPRYILWVAY